MPRRSLVPAVELLELRATAAGDGLPGELDWGGNDPAPDYAPGTPPIVYPSPRPSGPAGPMVSYTAAMPYAPVSPW